MARDRAAQRQFKINQANALSHEWPEATRARGIDARPTARPKASRKSSAPPVVRAAVLSRDRGCMAAGLVPAIECRGGLQAHHLWRRSQGGPNEMWNLKAVCVAHHEWIHRNVAAAKAVDLIRRRGDTGPEGPRIGP